MVEVGLRAVFVYAALQFVLQAIGRRMAGQITVGELAIVVTLGAAVGVPMQVPDRGMLAGMLILLIALAVQRGLAYMAFRSRRADVWAFGDVLVLAREAHGSA